MSADSAAEGGSRGCVDPVGSTRRRIRQARHTRRLESGGDTFQCRARKSQSLTPRFRRIRTESKSASRGDVATLMLHPGVERYIQTADVGNQLCVPGALAGFAACETSCGTAVQASDLLPAAPGVPRQSNFVSHPERGSVGSRRATWTVRPWPPGTRSCDRVAVTSAARRCRTAASLLTTAPKLGGSSWPAQRERQAGGGRPEPSSLCRRNGRGSRCRTGFFRSSHDAANLAGLPDTRAAREEPPRPFRRARHEDGPAVSDCLPRTLERATRLSSGSS